MRSHDEIDDDKVGFLALSQGGWIAPLAATQSDAVSFAVILSGSAVSLGEEDLFSDLTGSDGCAPTGIPEAEIQRRVNAEPPSRFDPRPYLADVEIPMLWIYGALDTSQPVTKDLGVLKALQAEGKDVRDRGLPEGEPRAARQRDRHVLGRAAWTWSHPRLRACPERMAEGPRELMDVSAVIVTYNALPWIERSLESLEGTGAEVIVVDHGSTDGTLELVRERFPAARVIEQENRGLGGGSNTGMRAASGRYYLLLNSDAWLQEGALEKLVAFADEHPEAAVVGPRLLNPDGSLQRSVRGFPSVWRLATEYFFLRKLAPRSRVLNAFYAGGFDHDAVREAEFVMGSAMLVRRDAADAVGLFDEDFFMFNEESDWCYRFLGAGWKVLFYPEAEVFHVGGCHDQAELAAQLPRADGQPPAVPGEAPRDARGRAGAEDADRLASAARRHVPGRAG